MKSLKIGVDSSINTEIIVYLKTVNGIEDVSLKDGIITVNYKESIINIEMIVNEIKLYLNIMRFPSVLAFDKCEDSNAKYNINIENICCEYCLCRNIEDLLYVDGIIKVSNNYDYKSYYNVVIEVCYDNNLVSEEKIKQYEIEFNK